MDHPFTGLTSFLLYCFFAYAMYRLAGKFRTRPYWHFLIPFYNAVLLCRTARISGWFVLVILIPYIGVFIWSFVVYGKIAERLGHNYWLFGILSWIAGLSLLILAFNSSMPMKRDDDAPVWQNVGAQE